jgi:hypothetical protein
VFTSPTAVHVWGGYGDLSIGGTTFTGAGEMGTLVPLDFQMGGAENSVDIVLSGVNPDLIALAIDNDARGAAVVIRRLIFNVQGTQLLDASTYFVGTVENMPIDDVPGGKSTITYQCESSARGLNGSGARMASHPDQLTIDATDKAFEYVAVAGEITIYWGGAPPIRAGQANGGQTGKPFGMGGSALNYGGSPGGNIA